MTTENRKPDNKIGDLVGIYSRGGFWYANFQCEGQQRRQSLKTRSKKEARRRAVRLEARLLDGEFRGTAKVPLLSAVIEEYRQYLKNEGRAKKTLQKYAKVFARLSEIAKSRSVTKISAVNLQLVDAYKSRRIADGAAKKTIHTELVVIRQVVNFALSRQMLVVDPLAKLKLKKPKPRPQPCWSHAEMEQIIAASRDPYRSMLSLLAETGLRVGELKHLTWDDLDFEGNQIHVREKAGWTPKTGDQRSIPMSSTARAILTGLTPRRKWVFTSRASAKYPVGDQQISERRLLEYLKRVLRKLGLAGHLHTFRHGFISNALCNGVPEAVVRRWVGHVDSEIIKIYTHVFDETSQTAMRRLTEANYPQAAQQPGQGGLQ